MRSRHVELFIAAFLALFVVLSPAAHFSGFSGSLRPEVSEEEVYPIEETDMVGQPTPNPDMNYLNGEKLDMVDFRGKTLVLYLWSTWAPTVPKGMWFLNQLDRKNEDTGLAILAANIGFRDRVEEIEYYVNRRNLELTVVTSTADVLSKFNVQGVPAVFIIDGEGIIRYEALGEIDETEFNEALGRVLDSRKGTDINIKD